MTSRPARRETPSLWLSEHGQFTAKIVHMVEKQNGQRPQSPFYISMINTHAGRDTSNYKVQEFLINLYNYQTGCSAPPNPTIIAQNHSGGKFTLLNNAPRDSYICNDVHWFVTNWQTKSSPSHINTSTNHYHWRYLTVSCIIHIFQFYVLFYFMKQRWFNY